MYWTLDILIPFHTLVKLVDAEDIANDKIRTHDLALELNNITNQIQTQTLDSSQQEQLMFTQPRDPKKTCIQKILFIVQITLSRLVSKNNEMMKIKEKPTLDQNLPKNHLFSTFVHHPMIEQKDMTHATEAEVHHEIFTVAKTQIHKTDIALHQEIHSAMTKTLLLHNTLGHDMINTKEGLDPTTLPTDLLIDLPTDMTLVVDIDHVRIQEITTILQDIHLPIDNLGNHEILNVLDHAHIQIQETNLIQFKRKTKQTQLILKSICILQLKWLML